MQEPKFSLNDILRYLSIGILIVALILINQRPSLLFNKLQSLKDYGWLLTGVLAFTIGSLYYLVYRNLAYPGIMKIQDLLRGKYSLNYRTYLRKLFNCSSSDAMLFWIFIRLDTEINLKPLDRESSGIHLLYMTSSLFLIFSFAHGVDIPDWIFPCATGLFFLAAFVFDRRIETLQYLQLKSIPREKLKTIWKNLRDT